MESGRLSVDKKVGLPAQDVINGRQIELVSFLMAWRVRNGTVTGNDTIVAYGWPFNADWDLIVYCVAFPRRLYIVFIYAVVQFYWTFIKKVSRMVTIFLSRNQVIERANPNNIVHHNTVTWI